MKNIKLLCILMALTMILSMGMLFVGCDTETDNDDETNIDDDSTNNNGNEENDNIAADNNANDNDNHGSSGNDSGLGNSSNGNDIGNDINIPENDNHDSWYETLDFNNQEIRFLTQYNDIRFAIINDGVTRIDTMTRSIAVDPSDDPMWGANIAVDQRNAYVENELGVRIVHSTTATMTAYIPPMFLTGIQNYDVLQISNSLNIGLILNENGAGHFLDLNMISAVDFNDVSQGENFIRVGQPWWDTDRYEKMTYNGRAFFVTGHLTQSWISGMYVTFVNATLWDENSAHVAALTGGETNIHQIVRDGGWHLDFITQLSKRVYTNLSGTDAITIGDRVGFVLHNTQFNVNVIPQALAAGAGVRYVDVDANGDWRLVLNEPGSPAAAFAEANYRLHYHANALQVMPTSQMDVMEVFADGNALMTVHMFQMMEIYLRHMEDSFYILPLPMLNEEQLNDTGYLSFVQPTVGLFTIPTVAGPNVRAITATLELMAHLSYQNVTMAYLHDTLAGFIHPGMYNDTIEMINLAHGNTNLCQAVIWPFQFNDGTTGPFQFFRRNITADASTRLINQSNISSWQDLINRHAHSVNQATDDILFAN